MRVYISADIEGCTGLVSWSQCGRPNSAHYDFGFARAMMTGDVNAAILGALEAGATEVVVKDSHGNSKNLLAEELVGNARLISGYGACGDGMMTGMEFGTFDAAILVGYHAMAGTLGGIMEHTITGGIHRLWLNGEETGEIGLSMGVATLYKTPVVAITSDAAGVKEAQSLVPAIQSAVVKTGYGRFMGDLLSPEVTQGLIQEAVRKGIESRSSVDFKTYEGPQNLRIEFHKQEEANMVAKMAGLRQTDGYTVEGEFADYRAAHTAVWDAVNISFAGRSAQD